MAVPSGCAAVFVMPETVVTAQSAGMTGAKFRRPPDVDWSGAEFDALLGQLRPRLPLQLRHQGPQQCRIGLALAHGSEVLAVEAVDLRAEAALRKILAAGALPVTLGGDHSVTIPAIAAFSEHGPLHVVHFDTHLDFVDERHGVRFGHGSPMRRDAERYYVIGLTQLGIRNVSSTAREGYADARRMGSDTSASGKSAGLAATPCLPASPPAPAIT